VRGAQTHSRRLQQQTFFALEKVIIDIVSYNERGLPVPSESVHEVLAAKERWEGAGFNLAGLRPLIRHASKAANNGRNPLTRLRLPLVAKVPRCPSWNSPLPWLVMAFIAYASNFFASKSRRDMSHQAPFPHAVPRGNVQRIQHRESGNSST
jgi:hypothetical protein